MRRQQEASDQNLPHAIHATEVACVQKHGTRAQVGVPCMGRTLARGLTRHVRAQTSSSTAAAA